MHLSNRKLILVIALSFVANVLLAHSIDTVTTPPHKWTLAGENKKIEGYFFMYKNGNVYIDIDHNIVNYPLESFSKADKQYVLSKDAKIRKMNSAYFAPQVVTAPQQPQPQHEGNKKPLLLILAAILVAGWISQQIMVKRQFSFAYCTIAVVLTGVSFAFSFRNTKSISSITSPYFLDSAFAPFKPAINTRWDANYFYVESKGIPNHEMMTGITKWQQQVPIPQCYIGANAWSIPLNPIIATNPVPVNQHHFLRGAVAIAANGVPIFNPYTNTGVDALVDGQLDNWGGHSGRADDYHYHIAPLSLYTLGQTQETLPCAFALDGFAVYGSKEPDGSNMASLDTCHGHFGANGVYHYHGTIAPPYMIGYMVGKVTEDSTLQIIPQAAAKPVRPSLTPLTGATITAFSPNGTNNGYNLTYTKSGQTYQVNYSWTTNVYTYNFVSPTGTTTSTYNGFTQCSIVLPLQLLSFTATKNNTSIKLNWTTSNELNTTSFEIERSSNNITWRSIGKVAANNTGGIHTYSFADESKPSGVLYYRLKCLDADGKYTYSAVKKIEIVNATGRINVYPNPSKGVINIDLENLSPKDVIQVGIFSKTGNKVYELSGYNNKINTHNWAKGLYTISIKTTQNIITKEIIVD